MQRSQAKFYSCDVLNVFLRIKPIKSRARMALETGLGEGSVRSVLAILKEKGLIESAKQGHYLTEVGEEWYTKLKRALVMKDSIKVSGIKSNSIVCLHLRPPTTPKPSYMLRDIAVRWGASGALIFYYTGQELVLPPSKTPDYGEDYSALKKTFDLKRGDYVIVVWGS
ncbi:hypothetical protein DRJ48_00650, partial [Candidatus Woesearchaeota archaeon]